MKKRTLLKIIFYFFCMPWRLMPTMFSCSECDHNVSFKQPSCGWCKVVFEWEDEKEYKHI